VLVNHICDLLSDKSRGLQVSSLVLGGLRLTTSQSSFRFGILRVKNRSGPEIAINAFTGHVVAEGFCPQLPRAHPKRTIDLRIENGKRIQNTLN